MACNMYIQLYSNPLQGEPPGWTDNSRCGWYNGTSCDCNCGWYDEDCSNRSLPVSLQFSNVVVYIFRLLGAHNQTRFAHLQETALVFFHLFLELIVKAVPPTCNFDTWSAYDGCQCGPYSCFIEDPDCLYTTYDTLTFSGFYVNEPVYGCPDYGGPWSCTATGNCTGFVVKQL